MLYVEEVEEEMEWEEVKEEEEGSEEGGVGGVIMHVNVVRREANYRQSVV